MKHKKTMVKSDVPFDAMTVPFNLALMTGVYKRMKRRENEANKRKKNLTLVTKNKRKISEY